MGASPSIDAVLPIRAQLGECPVWDGRGGHLFWIDIDARTVFRYHPATGVNESRELDGRPGSFVLTEDPDRLVVGLEHELVDMQWSSGTTTSRVVLEPGSAATRLNDGRCDPVGRYWVGSMDDPAGSGANGAMLHRVEPDDRFETIESSVGVSNGMAFSPDGTTMYWADTRRSTVWAYDYDVATGRRTHQRPFLDFDLLPGLPDGACVDAGGCYWVACVYGWAVLRATPDGVVDRIIELPVEKPSMPAFGGEGLDTLYITSISSGGTAPAAPDQPIAGALLAIDVGVTGLTEPRFAG
jgi:L-arabinonolactonase